jgi:hypothetical protein
MRITRNAIAPILLTFEFLRCNLLAEGWRQIGSHAGEDVLASRMAAGLLVALALSVGIGGAAARERGSVAMIAGGGIQFAANPNVRVAWQELRLSTTQVVMNYQLRNTSAEPQTLRAVFPLPELEMPSLVWEPNVALPAETDPNFVGFSVRIEGMPVTPALQQRATALSLDVTGKLFDSGLPLFPLVQDMDERIRALPAEVSRRLATLGLLAPLGDRVRPMWTLRSVLHWSVDIPAKGTVELIGSYTPVIGRRVFAEDDIARASVSYCLSPAEQVSAVRRARSATPLSQTELLAYVIPTSSNLLGPAEKARILIELPSESSIASLCASGFRRTGPLTLEWSGKGVMIEEDLRIQVIR